MVTKRSLIALAASLLVLYGLAAAYVPRTGFVTVDLGAIHLQVVRLATEGTVELPLGAHLTPVAHDYFPWRLSSTPPAPIKDWRELAGGWFAERAERDGRFLVIYPIGFAWLCALLFRALGAGGPVALSIVSGALVALTTACLGARLGLRHPIRAAVAASLASPLSLYCVLVWGHAPAVAAAIVGLYLLTPRAGGEAARGSAWSTAGAGVAIGLAAAFRNEGLLLAAIVGMLVALAGPRPRWLHTAAFLVGLALSLGGPLAYNKTTFGSFLDASQAARSATFVPGAESSPRGETSRPPLPARLIERASTALATGWECSVASDNLAPAAQRVWGAVLLAAVLACALGLRSTTSGVFRLGLLLGSAATLLYLAFAILAKPQQVPGVLLLSPVLIPGLAALFTPALWWNDARVPGLATLLFLAGCALRGSPGWQWGARYMLPCMPFLAVLGVRAFEDLARRPGAARIAMLHLNVMLATGLAMTAIGWRDLASEQAFRESEQRLVAEIGAPAVAFDHWWFSWENAPLALDRELFFVGSPEQLGTLIEHLRKSGIGRVALVTRGGAPAVQAYTVAAASRGWRVAGLWTAALPFGHVWHTLSLERSAGAPGAVLDDVGRRR